MKNSKIKNPRTFDELVEATKDMKLDLMHVSLGKSVNDTDSVSCFKGGDEWVLREIDDRQHVWEQRGTEEDIIKEAYALIRLLAR